MGWFPCCCSEETLCSSCAQGTNPTDDCQVQVAGSDCGGGNDIDGTYLASLLANEPCVYAFSVEYLTITWQYRIRFNPGVGGVGLVILDDISGGPIGRWATSNTAPLVNCADYTLPLIHQSGGCWQAGMSVVLQSMP